MNEALQGRIRAAKEGTGAMSLEPQAPSTEASAAASLRPLSIGELFDRAFSIYIRNVLTFASLLIVFMIPIAILQYFMTHNILDAYAGIIDSAIKHPSTPPDLSKLESATPNVLTTMALDMLLLVYELIALPLAFAAVVSGVSRAYLGLPVRFRACYGDAFKRWGWAIILSFLWGVVLIAVAVPATFFFVLLAALLVALGSALQTVGIVIASIVGLCLFIALAGLLISTYMAFASSFIACVLEKADPVRSFVLGITRIFGKGQFWRSVGVAFAMLLTGIGFSIVTLLLAGVTFWLTKSAFLYIAVAQLANVFFLAFAFCVVALYYYDIRIRREGFDLQLLADQLRSPDVPQPSASA